MTKTKSGSFLLGEEMFNNFYTKTIFTILITAICCSYFGQSLLFLIKISKSYYDYLVYFLPFVLLFTKYSNKFAKTHGIGMKHFIEAQKGEERKISYHFPILLTLNTLLAHIFSASVGREGVAVQLGGAVGMSFSKNEKNRERKNILIRLGMICGFSALFQTPLAACFFILEITVRRLTLTKNHMLEFCLYFVSSFLSACLSHFLGLEKFFVKINFDFNAFSLSFIFKTLLASVLLIFSGILFVVCQKYFKKICTKNLSVPWILLCIFMIVSVIFNFRYASLGTNLIDFSFANEHIYSYDFILKLILTALCTSIGFSGGEVTPLFAIGASFGVVLASLFNLPILVVASLGYTLVFSSATKTFITPIFLALEVFGWQIMIITIIPAFLIYFINRKYSIYL